MKLRSVVLLVVAALTAILSGSTQAGELQFGVKAGLSRANQTWETQYGPREHDLHLGFAFGNFADIQFTPILALRLDALYVQKGSRIKVEERTYNEGFTGRYITIKDRVDYLSLSVTGKANLLGGPVGIYLIGGPRLDIKVGGEFEISSLPSDSLYNSTVTGLVLGGGVELELSPGRLVLLEFRYDHDLADAGGYSATEADLVVKSKGFQILAGLRF